MSISISNAVSGKIEPKRANRWILKFDEIPGASTISSPNGAADAAEALAIDLLSASRPTLSLNGSDSISRINEKWKFAQNPTWENIQVVFYDFDLGAAGASRLVWQWSQRVYDVLNGTMGYAANYKVDASLILLGPGQTNSSNTVSTNVEIIEAWDLFGCFPNQVSFGELSYDNTDALRVTMDLMFDYANLHTSTELGSGASQVSGGV